jgi:peroxiredoxin Q/BCP
MLPILLVRHDNRAVVEIAIAGRLQTFEQLAVDLGQRGNGITVKHTVYLVGPDGKIRFARRGMPAPAEVLAGA